MEKGISINSALRIMKGKNPSWSWSWRTTDLTRAGPKALDKIVRLVELVAHFLMNRVNH